MPILEQGLFINNYFEISNNSDSLKLNFINKTLYTINN